MSADPVTPTPSSGEERPGAVIGRYRLLEKIGEGGMGVIWLADQREPVRRRVALKIIKLGMDTKEVVARFEAERQALALMDHPHIAKVFDAGATPSGRPYFVMEYIKGDPIVEYCDRERLDTRARLDLFTKVCRAIQHAHQKGVIHRDIKPSNVLVAMSDGAPIPKVIDFGVAKATSGDLTPKTLAAEGRVLGTPAYMSPEQAALGVTDVDTRSDVYALGVLLYELLTGTTPLDPKALVAAGRAEMLRAIREEEPAAPSRRVASLGDAGARAAQKRQVDVKRLGAELRRELDWIVMKCLEKDRARRYATANGLALDVLRHLDGEPVTAGPPGAAYRFRKFVRRHRAVVAAAGVVVGALVLGAAGTTTGMIRAFDAKGRADVAADAARLAAASEARAKTEAQETERDALAAAARAEAAQAEEEAARTRAEVVRDFVVTALQAGDATLLPGGGQRVTILAAMDRALADVVAGRFAGDPETEAGLKATIGVILRNNGRAADAETLLKEALGAYRRLYSGDHEAVAWAAGELGCASRELGEFAEARRLFRESLEMCRRLFPGDHEKTSTGLSRLGTTLDVDAAEPLLREAVAMSRRLDGNRSLRAAQATGDLAGVLHQAGRYKEAEALFEEALAMTRDALPGDSPATATALDNLGKARQALGRGTDAVDLLRKSLEMTRRIYPGDHPAVVTGTNNLAFALFGECRFDESARLSTEALAMERRIPPGDGLRAAEALSRLAYALCELRRAREAEPLAAESLAIRRRFHAGDDLGVAAALALRGAVMTAVGRLSEAVPPLTEAHAMYRRLAPRDAPEVATGWDNLGKALADVGRTDEAVDMLGRALAMRERMYERDNPDLATGLNNLAGVLFNVERVAEAEPLARRALEMNRRLYEGGHPRLAQSLRNFATLLRRTGRNAEAEPLASEAVAMSRRLSDDGAADLAAALLVLAAIKADAGDAAASAQMQDEALRMIRRPSSVDRRDALDGLTDLGSARYAVGAYDEAIPLFEEALKAQEAAWGREHPSTLATIGNLGANYVCAGRYAEAAPLLEEAWSAAKRLPQLDFVKAHLLDAYVHLADPARDADVAKVLAFANEILAASRAASPVGDARLAQDLILVGMSLLVVEAWDRSEPLLREGLALREKLQPDAWTTCNTRSVLGEALLGQKKFAEAEPLLLAGHRGLKERAATMPPVIAADRITKALERLVRLYEASGNAAEAAAWRAKLESERVAGSRPSTREEER